MNFRNETANKMDFWYFYNPNFEYVLIFEQILLFLPLIGNPVVESSNIWSSTVPVFNTCQEIVLFYLISTSNISEDIRNIFM